MIAFAGEKRRLDYGQGGECFRIQNIHITTKGEGFIIGREAEGLFHVNWSMKRAEQGMPPTWRGHTSRNRGKGLIS